MHMGLLRVTFCCLLAGGVSVANQTGDPPTQHLLLLDRDARPAGGVDWPGVLFTLDVETGAIVSEISHPTWRDPTDLLVEPDGSILILDYTNSDPGEPPYPGALFRVSPARDHVERVPIPPGLLDPTAMERAPDGSLWILDKNANPRGRGKGTIWRLSPDGRSLAILATGPPFVSPAALVFDGEGALILDADAGPDRSGTLVRLGLDGSAPREVRTLEEALSPLDLIALPGSAWLVVDANRHPSDALSFRGSLARIPREGAVTPIAPELHFVDPLHALLDGKWLWVVDANSDPEERGPDPMNAARIDALRRAGHLHGESVPRNLPELLARSTPGLANVVLPVGFGGFGCGALWRVELETGNAITYTAHERFVTPIAVALAPTAR